MATEDLTHFGVKGMKWGVRKDRSGSGNSNSKGQASNKSARPKRSRIQMRPSSELNRKLETAVFIGQMATLSVAAVTMYVVQKDLDRRTQAILKNTSVNSAAAKRGHDFLKRAGVG